MTVKYHVNNDGETGKCSATKGGCPFGDDAQHFPNPEAARKSYETSMAAQTVATVSKHDKITADNYDASRFGGFSYDEITFDEERIREQIREETLAGRSNISPERLERDVDYMLRMKKVKWDAEARKGPVKAGDKKVPLRLVPVGSNISSTYGYSDGMVYPPENKNDELKAKYLDGQNNVQYTDANTTVTVHRVPSHGESPNEFALANLAAGELSRQRARFAWQQSKVKRSV